MIEEQHSANVRMVPNSSFLTESMNFADLQFKFVERHTNDRNKYYDRNNYSKIINNKKILFIV